MLPSLVAQLLIISGVAVAVKHIRLPYTIALVSVGLLLGLLRHHLAWATELQLTPDFLFFGLLPPLLFEGSLGLSWTHLKPQLRPIFWIAVVGMLIATGLTGGMLKFGLGWSWMPALIFGSLISATDPISVLALFRQLKAPRMIATLVEGESLLNDGVAAVLFAVLVSVYQGAELNLPEIAAQFILQSVGGLLVGVSVAWGIGEMTRRIDDHLIEITLSTTVAYGSYLLAHQLHLSGVVATIAAGVYYGNWVLGRALSPFSQTLLTGFWEYVGFFCNSLVFLLIGTQVQLSSLTNNIGQEFLIFLIVLLARALTILVLLPVLPRNWKWNVLLFWGGLRGSIAIALALALQITERNSILLHTFAVVLFSLYIQGFTMKYLLRALKLRDHHPELEKYEMTLGELIAVEASQQALLKAEQTYHLASTTTEPCRLELAQRADRLREDLASQQHIPEVSQEQMADLQHLLLHNQLKGLREALTKGMISQDTYNILSQRVWSESEIPMLGGDPQDLEPEEPNDD